MFNDESKDCKFELEPPLLWKLEARVGPSLRPVSMFFLFIILHSWTLDNMFN